MTQAKISCCKDKSILAFKKAYSQLAKIISMLEEDRYCIDIMQQNLAVIGLLKSANQSLMESHLNTCFRDAMASSNQAKQQQMIEEILRVAHLSNK